MSQFDVEDIGQYYADIDQRDREKAARHKAKKKKKSSVLKPCPRCGAKAIVMHDVMGKLEFGWSVGCPRACIDDPVHKLGEEEFKKARLVMFGFTSKEKAIEAWNRRVGDAPVIMPREAKT